MNVYQFSKFFPLEDLNHNSKVSRLIYKILMNVQDIIINYILYNSNTSQYFVCTCSYSFIFCLLSLCWKKSKILNLFAEWSLTRPLDRYVFFGLDTRVNGCFCLICLLESICNFFNLTKFHLISANLQKLNINSII